MGEDIGDDARGEEGGRGEVFLREGAWVRWVCGVIGMEEDELVCWGLYAIGIKWGYAM